jgi:hypothetical protein
MVNDVRVLTARRITNPERDALVPGVVIATLGDKNKVLKAKAKLFKTIYKDVFISPDQSKEEKIHAGNLRSVVNAVNKGGRLSIRGNRVARIYENSGTHNNGENHVNQACGTQNSHNSASNHSSINKNHNNGANQNTGSQWANFRGNSRGNGSINGGGG